MCKRRTGLVQKAMVHATTSAGTTWLGQILIANPESSCSNILRFHFNPAPPSIGQAEPSAASSLFHRVTDSGGAFSPHATTGFITKQSSPPLRLSYQHASSLSPIPSSSQQGVLALAVHTSFNPPCSALHTPLTLSFSLTTFLLPNFLFFAPLLASRNSAFFATCSFSRFFTQMAFSRPLM